MGGKRFEDIVRILIYVQLFLASVCVGSSPCMPESDRLGRYTVIGGSGNTSSAGVPSGSRVQVLVSCNVGAIEQQSVMSQCSNGTWIPPWPRCEKPCSVPINRGEVLQFVNGDVTRPITSYYTPSTLPDGTQLVATCRSPDNYRLIGDQRRTCEGGQWTGEEPQCQRVQTQVIFFERQDNRWREVASNGTVVVYVHRENPRPLNVVCRDTSGMLRYTRLTTPLVNDGDLQHWHGRNYHGKRLDPISTDFSGMYTCNGSSSFHSVHVLFKAAECEVPAAPEHGRLLNGSRQQPRDIFPSGTSVSFECEDDYRLVGSRRITCEKGQWSDDPPVCTELDIRLFGGSGNYEGRVEVRVNGRWGTVCNETWDMDDATVVCRELGNRTAIKYDVMYGEGEGPILYTNSMCTGEEERLQDCPNEEPTVDVCKHTHDAGVQCSFKDVDLRLVGGSTPNEGRVEVYKKGVAGMGEWGRMCAGSEWDRREANVVCRTVGYPNGAEASSGSVGSGNGRVFITDVECTGTENTFLGCKEANFGNLQACPTGEVDATVVCIQTPLG
ncbi:scavenger receptor cysteine-rich type 1 protein M130 [Strongylocentrotus purpuratus]|uniref:Uncharacterized protein n=1 Tax=Strongylocentrotus purpuratus TaxID=7668 RepID=A0A7M7NDF1_STRPU|nr:scavenger receptor cysteine-rich type 1 protein M130 [Strongylocentrotus purpuratus]